MDTPIDEKINGYKSAMSAVTEDLKEYYPRAVVLFGSLARWLAGEKSDHGPNDMDLLVVCNNNPFKVENKDYGVNVELNRLRIDHVIEIASSLRYDTKAMALSKIYSRNVIKQHSIDVITACLLLGSSYNEFGIQQIEIDALTDKRDYSIRKVLYGNEWWDRLAAFARDRRGPWKRLSDRLVGLDKFEDEL